MRKLSERESCEHKHKRSASSLLLLSVGALSPLPSLSVLYGLHGKTKGQSCDIKYQPAKLSCCNLST